MLSLICLGQISLDEFGDAVDLLRKYMPSAGSKRELMNMCQMMDINKDGFVDLNEFLEAFRLCDQARKAPQPTKSKVSRRKSSLFIWYFEKLTLFIETKIISYYFFFG